MSKIFPFTETGYPPEDLRLGTLPENLRPGTPPKKSETGYPPEDLRLGTLPKNLRPGTPPKNLRLGTPPKNLRPGTPPQKKSETGTPPPGSETGTWDPPPRNVNRLKLLPFPSFGWRAVTILTMFPKKIYTINSAKMSRPSFELSFLITSPMLY